MVEISDKAKEILEKIKENNVDNKNIGENGRSAFWLWYDKVKEYVKNLDNSESPFISEQIYEMKYWGLIYYDKTIINNEITVFVTSFKFDPHNFWNWLNHAPLNEKLFTPKFNKPETWVNTERPIHSIQNNVSPICQSLGMKGIYKTQTANGKWYVCDKHLNPIGNKFLYDEIKRFSKHKDGTYAIGIAQNQLWKIRTNGLIIQSNTNISIDSKGNYVVANGDGADYVSENKHSKLETIISETINNYLRNNFLIA